MKTKLFTALGALIAGGLLTGFLQPAWWLGASVFLAGLTLAGLTLFQPVTSRLMETKVAHTLPLLKRMGPEAFCVLSLLVLALFLIPDVALGDRAVDHDHPVHFFKAWQLEQNFLKQGRLWGWSHQWYAGYPAQYLYPFGADIWVLAVRWATLGLLSLDKAYGIALWLFWFLLGYGTYRFGAVCFGRPVGLLAALFMMGDTAAFRFGGWVYAMQWGVWPQSLSVAFALLAMAQLPRVVKGESYRAVGLFGLFLGFALLTHPLQMLHFAIIGPVALVVLAITSPRGQWLRGTSRLIVGYAGGISIGALWILPFLATNDYATSYGAPWISVEQLASGLYNLNLLPGTWGGLIALGSIGLVSLCTTRRFSHLLIVVLTLALMFIGTTTFLVSFHLLELSDSFGFIQFQRFAILLKPYLFIAASYVIVLIVGGVAGHRFEHTVPEMSATEREGAPGQGFPPWRTTALVLLISFIALPIGAPFVKEVVETNYSRSLTGESKRPHRAQRAELVAWFKAQYPEGAPFFRIALLVPDADHSFADLGRELPFPLYKVGFTPASIYLYKLDSAAEPMLRDVNVRYIISDRPQRSPHYEMVERFGTLYLYEFRNWQPEPFKILSGDGEVTLERFDDEEILLRAGPGSNGRLRLNVSYFPRWKATLDGRPIDIEVEGDGTQTAFMSVPLEPGLYRFTFSRGAPEWIAFLLFLIGMTTVVIFCLVGSTLPGAAPIKRKLDKLMACHAIFEDRYIALQNTAAALMIGAIVLILTSLAIWRPPLAMDDDALSAPVDRVLYDMGDNLTKARVGLSNSTRGPCSRSWGRFICGPQEWQHVYQTVVEFLDTPMRRCIWAHPQDGGSLVMSFDAVPTGHALIGYYGVARSGGTRNTPVTLHIAVDAEPVHEVRTTRDGRVEVFEVPLHSHADKDALEITFSVDTSNSGQRHFCFNAQVVDLKQ